MCLVKKSNVNQIYFFPLKAFGERKNYLIEEGRARSVCLFSIFYGLSCNVAYNQLGINWDWGGGGDGKHQFDFIQERN